MTDTNQSAENPMPHDDIRSQAAPPQSDETTQPQTVSRVMFNYVVIAAAFLVVGIIIGVVTVGSLNTVDSLEVQRIVQNAVADIEIASGDGGSNVNMTQLVDDDPSLGNEDAPVTIVEFSAYACPYCGRHFNDTFQPLLDEYGDQIRYVYRDYPTINPNVSFPAAMAANCAREQDAFWEYHAALFDNQNQLGDEFFRQLAADLELDTEQFNTCLDEQRYEEEVNNDYLDGLVNDISGTPSFFINGEFYSGAMPYEFFEKVIQRELEAQGIAPQT